MPIELPDLSKKDCLYLSVACTIELSPEEKGKIDKITNKEIDGFSAYSKYSKEKNKFLVSMRIDSQEDKNNVFNFSFNFNDVPEGAALEEDKQDFITEILEILVQKNIKLKFNIDALFRYSIDNYESIIPLPLALPLPVKQKVEITGLHLSFIDNSYSQIIDLVGKHIFHNMVVLKESQIDSNLFINIFDESSQLSKNLLKDKLTKNA